MPFPEDFPFKGSVTGRFTIAWEDKPNIQNIPIRTEEGRKIREALINGLRKEEKNDEEPSGSSR